MPIPDRFFEDALALAQRWSEDSVRRQRYRRRHNRRRVRRVLRAVALLVVVTFVLVPSLVASGFLLGPHGMVGLLVAPFLLIVAWVVILRWSLKPPLIAAPTPLPSADLSALPGQTEEWIEQERKLLPWAAQSQLEHISQKLVLLAPQLQGLDGQSPAGGELRRLLGEELPTLVRGYRKLPATLVREPLYEGPSPEQKLVDGLAIIDGELGRMQVRLSRDDLHALAAHQRYLELKYKSKDEVA